jgi:diacylglycerol kinase (ATP)
MIMIKTRNKLDYTTVGIIYNPISTGDAPAMAQELYHQLKVALSGTPIKLHKTQRPNHGEHIAYKLASDSKKPLIISVSGDGGYSDVVNGAVRAQEKFRTEPICAVHGAGNANDHRRALKEMPLFEAIMTKNIRLLDILAITIMPKSGPPVRRYAHSYAGLGLTPEVAAELNRHKLTRWLELRLVIKTFAKFKPFTILVDKQPQQFDNLVFGNINQMAKVTTLSKDGRPDDGKFEVIATPHNNKFLLLYVAAKAAISHLGAQNQVKKFEFFTVEPLKMQLDGEVIEIRPQSKVVVAIAERKLRSVV